MPARKLERLVTNLFKTHRFIQEHVRDGDKLDPYTFLRVEALRFIAANKASTMKDLANYFHVTAPAATSLIGGLAKAGYVTRKEGEDRRVVHLVVTERGRKLIEEGMARLGTRMKEVFSVLSQDDIETLSSILERMNEKHERDHKR